jgi:hypothetical protein
MKFVGNCNNIINWEDIVKTLLVQEPAFIGPRHRENDPVIGISEIAKLWNTAGYRLSVDGGSAGWAMYLPSKNFNQSVVDVFSEYVGINPINAWISRIDPGMMAPWHWDANDAEDAYEKMPNMVRFSCHISAPSPGHVLICEDTCLYNQEQGNVWQWPDRKSWHAGANCGLVPKFLFNIFGTKK